MVHVQSWLVRRNQKLKLVTSLKIMFEFEFMGKPKNLSLAWLGLTRGRAKLKLNIKPKK